MKRYFSALSFILLFEAGEMEVMSAGGFSFENCFRNGLLESKGFVTPKATKTGTTIVGVIFRDGVVLGADTRATEGTIVSDKNCSKIHFLAPNIYCCGAGTAADTEMSTRMIASQLELHRLEMDRVVPTITANRMLSQMLFRYRGYMNAAFVLGGVDSSGPHLYSLYPHGSTNKLPYVTMGSGSLAAMSVFESGWKANMERPEAMKLVRDAIAAGIFNDLGSGSNVDLCIITKDHVEHIRPYDMANVKGQRQGKYRYPKGTTATLTTQVIPLEVESETVSTIETAEAMDTST